MPSNNIAVIQIIKNMHKSNFSLYMPGLNTNKVTKII